MQEPIIVFVHIHYPEVWAELLQMIDERLTVPFRLVVTTSLHPYEPARPKSPHLVDLRVLPVENRGRDIRPFLQALASTGNFDVGLKLHTKKSPQRADGSRWLKELLDSLVPSDAAAAIVSRLRADQRMGFVAPAGFCLPVEPWILQNAQAMDDVMQVRGDALEDGDMTDAYFAAGSMFWFRRDAIAPLATQAILDLFEPEAGQLDGTIAHGVERLFAVEARRNGFLTVPVPVLMESDTLPQREQVMDATRHHSEMPNPLFPGPYIPSETAMPAIRSAKRPGLRIMAMNNLSPIYMALPEPVRKSFKRLIKGDR